MHGEEGVLKFEDETGAAIDVTATQIKLVDSVQLVMLIACNSKDFAVELLRYRKDHKVLHAVCTNNKIDDEACIVFSSVFYEALNQLLNSPF